jgi:hypothetical protein
MPMTGRRLAQLLLHEPPSCRHGTEARFNAWRNKERWRKASSTAGLSKPRGEQLAADAQAHYDRCGTAYQAFVKTVCGAAFAGFVVEFDVLSKLYADYKRQAALLDFDDLLYHARDLLAHNEAVRQDLSRRYPRILVDEFQDTDPLQAEILWRLCGDGAPDAAWIDRRLRPGSLFVVGDPKQAIYRFRGADVDTYIEAKRALLKQDPGSVRSRRISVRSNPFSISPTTSSASSFRRSRDNLGSPRWNPRAPRGMNARPWRVSTSRSSRGIKTAAASSPSTSCGARKPGSSPICFSG